MVKCNFFFVCNGLRRWAIGSFYIMSYFSIQVNGELNVRVQSVTKVIDYGAKCVFEKFRVQSVIYGII